MNNFMDEMELAVHGLRHARDKLNVKHLGTMTTIEQEMDKICENALKSARSHKSHLSFKSNNQIIGQKSHRSHKSIMSLRS